VLTPTPQTQEKAMTVLIVEDQHDILQILRLNWPDSRDTLGCLSPILDINLPDGSGTELLRKARDRLDIPVVMISGAGGADSRADAISAGADNDTMKAFSWQQAGCRTMRLDAFKSCTALQEPPLQILAGGRVCHDR
jgi:CheY-like chemotaxis protein